MSRVAFDIIGLAGEIDRGHCAIHSSYCNAGFDYKFNAIQNEENPVYLAYKRMFGMTLDQKRGMLNTMVDVYFPVFFKVFVSIADP